MAIPANKKKVRMRKSDKIRSGEMVERNHRMGSKDGVMPTIVEEQ
jgi:hypothetical protein